MKPPLNPRRINGSLFVKIGRWFEASATGSGVFALVMVVVLLLAVEVVRWFAS
jgi:hypothetical protein